MSLDENIRELPKPLRILEKVNSWRVIFPLHFFTVRTPFLFIYPYSYKITLLPFHKFTSPHMNRQCSKFVLNKDKKGYVGKKECVKINSQILFLFYLDIFISFPSSINTRPLNIFPTFAPLAFYCLPLC